MLIKLIPKQVPLFWDTIKYGCKSADTVHQDNYLPYFNELLHALLSDKAQCFVRLDESRVIVGLLVTRFIGNKITGEKDFHLQSAYSFKSEPRDIWAKDFKVLLDVASKANCANITFETSNQRLAELCMNLGFKEVSRSYAYKVGG